MPVDPLETRLLDAVRLQVSYTSDPQVDDDKVYARSVLTYSADRDGLPGIVVAWTENRPVPFTPKLSWKERQYALTALLVTASGGSIGPNADANKWRDSWATAVLDALGDGGLIDEVHYVDVDTQTIINVDAFEQAGLWTATASILVTVRLPY